MRSKQDFKYSVIIPVFNNLNGIKRIIECNARQFKLHNCEIIIIDDGSFEKIEIDLNYENITVHRLKKNTGVARARNIGIQKSRGEYVIFLDSDDVLVGNYFENLDLRISQNNLDVLCFGAIRVNAGTHTISVDSYKVFNLSSKSFLMKNYCILSGSAIKGNVAKDTHLREYIMKTFIIGTKFQQPRK